ncbi:MAG: carboxypeptidase regulatory-like domain-containing protein [Blastocatellia bacterium]|nr:carboxypeptidase regulatory-like domain-containing protein [Blastocatellia bacterium]
MTSTVAALWIVVFLGTWPSSSSAQIKSGRETTSAPKPPPVRVALQPASITVLTGVPGADVRLERIGGRSRRVETRRAAADGGATFEPVSPGRYRVVASAPDCRDVIVETRATAGHSARVDARLTSVFGTLVLGGTGLGADARILVDGVEVQPSRIERTSDGCVRIRLEPGERELVVESPRRVAHRERVRVVAGQDAVVAVTLPLVPGRVRVRTTPGATIYVDDATAGRIPSSGELSIPVDADVMHRIRVEADDFEPFAADSTAAPGSETVLAAELTRIPTSGPFGDVFLSEALEQWEAPAGWRTEPSRQTLVVSGDGVGIARSVHYEDFDFVFNLKLVDGPGAAWVVRGSARGTGYVFVLAGPKAPWPNQLRVCEMRDGRFDTAKLICAALPVIPDVVVGESYSVRVRVEGNTVRTWLRSGATGQEVSIGNFVDADRRFRTGGIGFAGLGGRFEVNGVEAKPLSTTPNK